MKVHLDLKVYLVRSQDGKWFRAKGQSGYGESWVEDIKKAKIYPRIGPARATITWWSNNYPAYGVPDLVEIHSLEGEILDELDRVIKSQEKKQQEIQARELRLKQWKLEAAQRRV